MFTGLIEDIGILTQKGKNFLFVRTKLDDIKLGDSLSVSGVCLTVVEMNSSSTSCVVKLDVMPETFVRTNLKFLKTNSTVNLERALKLNDRLGGHIVQGHVEGIGKLSSVTKKDNARILKITVNKQVLGNIVTKGSVALDGISLTVAGKSVNSFSVSVIPETWEKTNLRLRKTGDFLNIETDFLLKNAGTKQNNDKRMVNLLKEEGFL